jgi:hypothetical protein
LVFPRPGADYVAPGKKECLCISESRGMDYKHKVRRTNRHFWQYCWAPALRLTTSTAEGDRRAQGRIGSWQWSCGTILVSQARDRRFDSRLGSLKTFLSTLLLSPHGLHDVRCRRHLSSKNLRDSQTAHVEEEDKTVQPQQSTEEERTRGDQVVLSGRDKFL